MDNTNSSLQGQRTGRIEKLTKFKKLGINPYPANSIKEYSNLEVKDNFEKYENKRVTLSGRLMSWREHGHLIFGNIQDDSGKIQLYIKDEVMPIETKGDVIGWNDFDLIDLGDILQVSGIVTKTNTGEVSILVDGIVMLTKTLRPLPEKWHGIQDKEERYRRRYLDMTMNPEIRRMFQRRSLFWKATRDFLNEKGFFEVNIPVLEHLTGGADAKPFVTHFDALDTDFYLRISHELPLKRLLGAGFEKVYDLGPRFRNEGFSDEHLPEHIAMEFYWAYADVNMGMDFMKEMYRYIAKAVYGTSKFTIKEFEVDLDKEWEVLDYATLLKDRWNVDIYNTPVEEMSEILKKNGLDLGENINRSRAVDNLWKLIRKDIGGPAFVTNIPKFLSPLAKSTKSNPIITERVFPIIGGSELANAFGELNDPLDQLDRFVEQQQMRESGDDEAQMMDIDFVEMLEYGMPPAFGFGMSERVFWYFENVTAREGVPFPPMRWGLDNSTKTIYKDIIQYIDHNSGENTKVKKQDLSKKFVTVLNEELSGWKLLNTASHLTAMLGNTLEKGEVVSRNTFTTKEGLELPANSQFPVVAVSAKQAQLQKLALDVLKRKDIKYLIYTMDMIDTGIDDKLAKVYSESELKNLNICGIGIFADTSIIKELTGKFSLWK